MLYMSFLYFVKGSWIVFVLFYLNRQNIKWSVFVLWMLQLNSLRYGVALVKLLAFVSFALNSSISSYL
ncbi:hypothetical protein VNO77_16220 [Canavalia gladiata]|uniref:Uncharacterized protein n=1 Tax=Canavalia gladiata TaxID=3824 RepID=A0AAN9M548_CANGL